MSKKITLKEVQKTAELARINLSKNEEQKLTEELSGILDFFDDIQEAQFDDVEKFDHYQLSNNQLRVDEVLKKQEGLVEGIKGNFPKSKDDYLKVKTVINK